MLSQQGTGHNYFLLSVKFQDFLDFAKLTRESLDDHLMLHNAMECFHHNLVCLNGPPYLSEVLKIHSKKDHLENISVKLSSCLLIISSIRYFYVGAERSLVKIQISLLSEVVAIDHH